VSIKWVRGKNPDLHVYNVNTGKEIEVLDLSKYSYNELHQLFNEKFGKRGGNKPNDISANKLNEQESNELQQLIDDSMKDDNDDMETETYYVIFFLIGITVMTVFVCYKRPLCLQEFMLLIGCNCNKVSHNEHST